MDFRNGSFPFYFDMNNESVNYDRPLVKCSYPIIVLNIGTEVPQPEFRSCSDLGPHCLPFYKQSFVTSPDVFRAPDKRG